ncbi:uncharacterized protein Osi23 [Ochlerotatus camptorhynchus]|uniref:uncharacterized protein Osi23 n=1 Tax=Ochlerotatus camptorhynchus TaxID=644619 RepID=UPI0031CFB724
MSRWNRVTRFLIPDDNRNHLIKCTRMQRIEQLLRSLCVVNIKRSSSAVFVISLDRNGDDECLLNIKMRESRLILVLLLFPFGCLVLGGSVLRGTLKQLAWEAKDLFKICASKNDSRWQCLREESLAAMDEFAGSEMIPLVEGISLVRVKNGIGKTVKSAQDSLNNPETIGNLRASNREGNRDGSQEHPVNESKPWTSRVLAALDHMFQTHVLQIDLFNSVGGGKYWMNKKEANWLWKYHRKLSNQSAVEGRHRRQRQQMIPMMIFGVTVFGMFAVPLGFQFLAALSGKAFLMAKLALLLASINGMKRVASTGIHYGLYHPLDHHHAHHSQSVLYDRESGYGPRAMPPIE